MRYRAFADKCKELGVVVPEYGSTVIFTLPMPKSWSKKKRAQMDGEPHQQTPDVDNLAKALLDSVYDNDCRVWDIRFIKRWGVDGRIDIENTAEQRPRRGD